VGHAEGQVVQLCARKERDLRERERVFGIIPRSQFHKKNFDLQKEHLCYVQTCLRAGKKNRLQRLL
jgi:hypothetical protein